MIQRIQYDEGVQPLSNGWVLADHLPTVDEVVGDGDFHLEMMHEGLLWMRLGDDTFTVTIKRRWFRSPVIVFCHHGKV